MYFEFAGVVWLNSFSCLCPPAQYKTVLLDDISQFQQKTASSDRKFIRQLNTAFRAVTAESVLNFCDILICQHPSMYDTEFWVPVTPTLFISMPYLPAFLKILQSASRQFERKPCKVAYRGGADGMTFHRKAPAYCIALPENCQNGRSRIDLIPVRLLRVNVYVIIQ